MNIYFVFEGKTEATVYRNWLSHLVPNLTEVDRYQNVVANNYFYESDMGVPDCFKVVANAIQEINLHPVFDRLVLVIDADRMTVAERKATASKAIIERLKEAQFQFKTLPPHCTLEILVQRVCLETWFLGNRKFFVRNPQSPRLLQYIRFYDVSKEDPEELAAKYRHEVAPAKYVFGYPTIAHFHVGYLKEIFRERNTIYLKARPQQVQEVTYLAELIKRCDEENRHLGSFQSFLSFCRTIHPRI